MEKSIFKMEHLDPLLECDNANIEITKKCLYEIEPKSLDAIEQCAGTLDNLGILYGEKCDYDKHHAVVAEWAGNFDLNGDTALELLKSATIIGDAREDKTDVAMESMYKAVSILAKLLLTLRLKRDFLFSISDFLRLKVTPALGYLRIQSETFGILKLLNENSKLGEEWFDSAFSSSGKSFHNKWHSQIVRVIRDFGLYDDYSRGSNMALHTRASGIAMGWLVGSNIKRKKAEIKLTYQEIDDPRQLFFWFGILLRFYRKALINADIIFPELSAGDFDKAGVTSFFEIEDAMWAKAVQAYNAMKTNR